MTKRLNAAEAIANILGWDIEDVKDSRYHYGHTTKPIYTAGDYYYCATVEGKEPAKYHDKSRGLSWNWKPCEDIHTNKINGWVVWKAHMNNDRG